MKHIKKILILFTIILYSYLSLVLYTTYNDYTYYNQYKTNKNTKTNTTLDIVFSADDNYILPFSVALTSLGISTKTPVNVHLLTQGITEKNNELLTTLISKFPLLKLEIKKIDESIFKHYPTNKKWSKNTYFRYLIPTLFKEKDKILYLDADTTIHEDLTPLWNTNLKQYSLAAIKDQYLPNKTINSKEITNYVNAGVLLMNTKKIREEKKDLTLFNQTEALKNKIKHLDQDIINLVFLNDILFIDKKYNCFQTSYCKNATIIHYASKKPWKIKSHEYYKWHKIKFYRDEILNNKEISFLTLFIKNLKEVPLELYIQIY